MTADSYDQRRRHIGRAVQLAAKLSILRPRCSADLRCAGVVGYRRDCEVAGVAYRRVRGASVFGSRVIRVACSWARRWWWLRRRSGPRTD